MRRLPLKVEKRIELRKQQKAFRTLGAKKGIFDLSSNDYLGYSRSMDIFDGAHRLLQEKDLLKNGSTGSRLLSGNHELYDLAEQKVAAFHNADTALIFNSGYDANVGFFGNVPQRADVVLYDELVHASIRDGISMGNAKAIKFKHNDLTDLRKKLKELQQKISDNDIYIISEAVFSMDGDMPNVKDLISLTEEFQAFLVLDEAHSLGVMGDNGKGIVQELELEEKIFARILTFGKGLGAHGAVILGSGELKEYLVNYARSLIYSTALPPHAVATIIAAYDHLNGAGQDHVEKLRQNINYFLSEVENLRLQEHFIPSTSAVHCCIVPGNENVKHISHQLQKADFDVKPILSPTVPRGKERLRFCLHSYNSPEEISGVLSLLAKELRHA